MGCVWLCKLCKFCYYLKFFVFLFLSLPIVSFDLALLFYFSSCNYVEWCGNLATGCVYVQPKIIMIVMIVFTYLHTIMFNCWHSYQKCVLIFVMCMLAGLMLRVVWSANNLRYGVVPPIQLLYLLLNYKVIQICN